MVDLIKRIKDLKKSKIKLKVDSRIKEFQKISKSDKKIFSELCFCILTANFNALKSIKIQKECEEDFYRLNERELSKKLKQKGHRFPNARAKYITSCQKYSKNLKKVFLNYPDTSLAREWLVKNIKGIGMKEASHFLRNIGYNDVAIIDFHIINLLIHKGFIIKPKTKSLTKKRYLEIEKILENIAQKTNLTLSELDLYLWFIETGKILK